MALTINKVITGIIVIIVILVVGSVFIQQFQSGTSTFVDIAEEVFYADAAEKQLATDTTVSSYKSFIETSGTSCKTGCFCNPSPAGDISSGYLLQVKNEETSSVTTVYDNEQVPLEQDRNNNRFGLLVVYEENKQRKLGCLLPSNFQVKGSGEEDNRFWFVDWADKRGGQFPVRSFPGETEDQAYVYKTKAGHLCFFTDIVNEDFVFDAGKDTLEGNIANVDSIPGFLYGSSLDPQSIEKFKQQATCN